MAYQPTGAEVDLAALGIRLEVVRVREEVAEGTFAADFSFGVGAKAVSERSLVLVDRDSGQASAVPMVDIIKYLLQHEPALLERARTELES